MTYIKHDFKNGQVLNAQDLNEIEGEVVRIGSDVDTLENKVNKNEQSTFSEIIINDSEYRDFYGSLGTKTYYLASPLYPQRHKEIDINGIEEISLKVSGEAGVSFYAFTKNFKGDAKINDPIDFCQGITERITINTDDNIYHTVKVPNDAKYLVITTVDGAGIKSEWDIKAKYSKLNFIDVNKEIEKKKSIFNQDTTNIIVKTSDDFERRTFSLGIRDNVLKWYKKAYNSRQSHITINVDGLNTITLRSSVINYFAFAGKDFVEPQSPSSGSNIFYDFDDAKSLRLESKTHFVTYSIPDDVKYIILNTVDGADGEVYWEIIYNYCPKNLFGDKLNVASWNVGHWNLGKSASSSINNTNYKAKKLEYRRRINEVNADILFVQEYSKQFNSSDSDSDARNEIFSCYKYFYTEPTQRNYQMDAIFSKYPIDEVATIAVPSDVQKNLFTKYVEVVTNGVILVCVHLDWADREKNLSQINYLIDRYKIYSNVIICGDFNTTIEIVTNSDDPSIYSEDEVSEMAQQYWNIWTDNGFQIANFGYIGELKTYSAECRPINGKHNYVGLDNIVTKGFDHYNINMYLDNIGLSDHCLISSELKQNNTLSE